MLATITLITAYQTIAELAVYGYIRLLGKYFFTCAKRLMDVGGILLAFAVTFVAAPLIAVLFSRIPMDTGIIIGLFLVAVMPSTLSSGVVMTAAAGARAGAGHARQKWKSFQMRLPCCHQVQTVTLIVNML